MRGWRTGKIAQKKKSCVCFDICSWCTVGYLRPCPFHPHPGTWSTRSCTPLFPGSFLEETKQTCTILLRRKCNEAPFIAGWLMSHNVVIIVDRSPPSQPSSNMDGRVAWTLTSALVLDIWIERENSASVSAAQWRLLRHSWCGRGCQAIRVGGSCTKILQKVIIFTYGDNRGDNFPQLELVQHRRFSCRIKSCQHTTYACFMWTWLLMKLESQKIFWTSKSSKNDTYRQGKFGQAFCRRVWCTPYPLLHFIKKDWCVQMSYIPCIFFHKQNHWSASAMSASFLTNWQFHVGSAICSGSVNCSHVTDDPAIWQSLDFYKHTFFNHFCAFFHS